eukprot:m.141130 g.141130  ORF g.141130 m.141130 type:complete len:472 (+) comp14839_c0_seq5:206-1621(+)
MAKKKKKEGKKPVAEPEEHVLEDEFGEEELMDVVDKFHRDKIVFDDDNDLSDDDDDNGPDAVLGIDADETDDDDDGGEDEEDEDVGTWGRKRKQFYDTDFVDPDFMVQEEEMELAKEEEEEAMRLQKQQSQQLSDDVFGIPMGERLKSGASSKKSKERTTLAAAVPEAMSEDENVEVVQRDFSNLSREEKLAILADVSPELSDLCDEYVTRSDMLEEEINPALENYPKHPYYSCKKKLLELYLLNIGYYLYAKSKGVSPATIASHPCMVRLLHLRRRIVDLEKSEEDILKTVVKGDKKVLASQIQKGAEKGKGNPCYEEQANDSSDDEIETKVVNKKMKTKKSKLDSKGKKSKKTLDAAAEDYLKAVTAAHKAKKAKKDLANMPFDLPEDDGRDEESELNRGITWSMKANKGLTPSRKKEVRNPRVRNKNKFIKAQKRRKGQVVSMRNEKKKYRGEEFGIKTNLIKSVKLS